MFHEMIHDQIRSVLLYTHKDIKVGILIIPESKKISAFMTVNSVCLNGKFTLLSTLIEHVTGYPHVVIVKYGQPRNHCSTLQVSESYPINQRIVFQ